MKLTLYNNFSENNNINKTIVKIIELNGTLREATSITNPSIMIELDVTSLKEDDYVVEDNQIYVIYNGEKITWNSYVYDYVLAANYCYITEFKRYYFIADIISEGYNLWRLVMNVDVSMSFKNDILDLYAFVRRNENTYNEAIEDNERLYNFNQTVEFTDVTKTDEITFNPNLSSSDINFAITYLEKSAAWETDPSLVTSPNTYLPSLKPYALGKQSFSKFRFINYSLVRDISSWVFDNESDGTYIISLVAYPFTIPCTLSQEDPLKLGEHVFTGSNTYLGQDYSGYISKYFLIAQFNASDVLDSNDYLSYEPYTRYELYLPYFGYTELKSSDIVDSTIKVYYSFEWDKGTAVINICNDTKKYIIKSLTAQIGINMAINRTNQQQLNDERTQMAIKGVIGTIGSGISIGAGVATGNPFMIAQGVLSMTSTFADIGAKLATQHERATTSNNSSSEGCYGIQKCLIKKTYMTPKDPTDYSKLFGKPLNEYVQLNTLSGFTQVGEVHLENFASANSTEKQLIDTLLKDGIIL